ncbi:hypothetical protein C5167_011684 [Papaver somniferum]|uniref:Uncharacterized protein n=1 Tax=Papaver somniferum TaxID=3469 RepID=A0A4Y7K6Z2_PAPSO|nr:hypothetical protein C5167_011684 [Papaver somniferum]
MPHLLTKFGETFVYYVDQEKWTTIEISSEMKSYDEQALCTVISCDGKNSYHPRPIGMWSNDTVMMVCDTTALWFNCNDVTHIRMIPFAEDLQEDKLIWMLTNKGDFTTKSFQMLPSCFRVDDQPDMTINNLLNRLLIVDDGGCAFAYFACLIWSRNRYIFSRIQAVSRVPTLELVKQSPSARCSPSLEAENKVNVDASMKEAESCCGHIMASNDTGSSCGCQSYYLQE